MMRYAERAHTQSVRFRWLGSVIAALLLLSACTSSRVEKKPWVSGGEERDVFFDQWTTAKEESIERDKSRAPGGMPSATENVPAEQTPSPEILPHPVSPVGASDRTLPTMIVEDLDLGEQTEVGVVLRALAKAGGVNILVGEGVKGKVLFNFNEVPWNEAFQSLLSSAGLTFDWEGSIIRVMSLDDMKRELEVDKLMQERQVVAMETQEAAPMDVSVIRIRYSDASALAETLQQVMTVGRGDGASASASVTVDVENNMIILRGRPGDLEQLAALIVDLDKPKAQILIEARIVETNRSTAEELGVQWGGGNKRIRGDRLYSIAGTGLDQFGSNFPANLADGDGLKLGFSAERIGGGELLTMQLTALQEAGRANILSSPSVTTMDNVLATIESGEERAYQESTGGGSTLTTSVAWKKAVLKLEVTPHVVDDDLIRMEIVAQKDSFDESKPESNGEFPVNTKHASTTLLLRNGETTVIGGLSQESRGHSDAGVPYAKSIPIIGALFRKDRSAQEFDEILIFITPHLLGVTVAETLEVPNGN
ncbi:MAG: type IV pilus assembly protein PilQ [Kiritimatiellia bacterium]|jgi:type IV pilus assembly protein PilQ